MVEKLNVELGADFGNFSRWHNYVEIASVCYGLLSGVSIYATLDCMVV